MRTCTFPLAAILALAIVFPSHAAEKPRPAQVNQAKKVWTNDDLDQLRARGLISLVGPEAPEVNQATTQPAAATAPSEPAGPVYSSRLEDPEWYAQQASNLQMLLDQNQTELRHAQEGLAEAAEGITQPGIALDRGNVGITPEAGIDILEARVREVQSQLDELSELARRNGIPPGEVRG